MASLINFIVLFLIYNAIINKNGGKHMWTRKELKDDAKGFLRVHYWKAFLIVLITNLAMFGTGSVGQSQVQEESNLSFSVAIKQLSPVDISTPSAIYDFYSGFVKSPVPSITFVITALSGIVVGILWVAIGLILEVGQSRFFIYGFMGKVDVKNVFSGFKNAESIPILKTQILKTLFIFLWSFLLVIPGIIKTYQYRYVPYILAEDPYTNSVDALKMSKAMTMGHKWDIFVLDFSFILWLLLNSVTFGIASLFINPYIEATNAKLYNILSNNEYKESAYENTY